MAKGDRGDFLDQVMAEEKDIGDPRSARVLRAIEVARAQGYTGGYTAGRRLRGTSTLWASLYTLALSQGKPGKEALRWADEHHALAEQHEND